MIYTKSDGTQIDTASMADIYLQRALAKAQVLNDQDNIAALEAEINSRQ